MIEEVRRHTIEIPVDDLITWMEQRSGEKLPHSLEFPLTVIRRGAIIKVSWEEKVS